LAFTDVKLKQEELRQLWPGFLVEGYMIEPMMRRGTAGYAGGGMADDVRETLSVGFRNEKHKVQWKSTLQTYASPLRAKRRKLMDAWAGFCEPKIAVNVVQIRKIGAQ
jgi:hypothetical protein